MSEYWKSTPKYWCKHCSIYVRDTKVERANHDSTAKHQGAIKRSLRDLHRGHEREEREKERAKREVDRLNGIVSSTPSTAAAPGSSRSQGNNGGDARGSRFGGVGHGAGLTGSERKRQAEELASLGVSIPDEFRGDLAMAGEWTVTNTRVVLERKEGEGEDVKAEALATGVRKRERNEDEVEREEALNSLFKKPRTWGRDSRGNAGDLDALLGGGLVKKEETKTEDAPLVKKEDGAVDPPAATPATADTEQGDDVKQEEPAVKKEPSEEDGLTAIEEGKTLQPTIPDAPGVKSEEGAAAPEAPALMFKKRKPKNIRQK